MAKNEKMGDSPLRPFGIAALFCALLMAASPSAMRGQTVKDDLGFEFRLGDPPRRIVSLAPNITEILFALGLGERVAGVTRYCDFPAEAAGKAKVGGLADPDMENIQSLGPDLVLAFRGTPLETVRKMRELRLPVFVLDEGDRLEELSRMIVLIGRVTRSEAAAGALSGRLRAEVEAVKKRLARAARVRVFLLLPGEGLWTCGRRTFLHDLLEKAAAENVAAGIPRPWAPFSREKLQAEDPDVLILLAPGRKAFEEAAARLKSDPRLMGLTAVRRRRLAYLDENKASRFGPRLVEALAELALALHPDCF
jgi:iron complex transport system substrate-binding protein